MSSQPPHRAAPPPSSAAVSPLAQLVHFAQERGLDVSITLGPGALPLSSALEACSDIARRCSHPLKVSGSNGTGLITVTTESQRPEGPAVVDLTDQAPLARDPLAAQRPVDPHLATAAAAQTWSDPEDPDDWPQGRRETQVLAVETPSTTAPESASVPAGPSPAPPAVSPSNRVSRRAVRENVATQSGDSW